MASRMDATAVRRVRRDQITARCPEHKGQVVSRAARVAASTLLLATSGCSTVGSVHDFFLGGSSAGTETARLSGFIGAAVADEPRAALAGRDILAAGGTAADAAVAMGFMLGVTLPSRAGLGGGGACLAYSPAKTGPGSGNAEAILFLPVAGGSPGAGTDRPAAVPMTPRGLYALSVRYGKLPFESLLSPAEQAARFGIPAPRALIQDLAVVAGPLLQDPNARAVFGPGGQPLQEGSTIQQPELAATIAAMRTTGVGDLYIGALSHRLVDGAAQAGGGLMPSILRDALPRTGAPVTMTAGRDLVAFLPLSEGGASAASIFQSLQAGGSVPAPSARPLPASTGWLTLDRDGNSVACTVTMDNLFGTGRIAPGTGLLLAAVPSPAPLLSAAIAWNPNLHGFRAAVVGTGQEGAAIAGAVAMKNALASAAALPALVPTPGRADAIACSRYLPDSNGSCNWAVDPRTPGLAAGGN